MSSTLKCGCGRRLVTASGERRGFRIRVNLARFYSDERAQCYVWVRAALRVSWLLKRLRNEFRLDRCCLVSRGYLLLPADPLKLLRPDDPVEVVPIDHIPHNFYEQYSGTKNEDVDMRMLRPETGAELAKVTSLDESDGQLKGFTRTLNMHLDSEAAIIIDGNSKSENNATVRTSAVTNFSIPAAEDDKISNELNKGDKNVDLSETDSDLIAVKRRALELLENITIAKRRRRRVRRRHRVVTTPSSDSVPVHGENSSGIEPIPLHPTKKSYIQSTGERESCHIKYTSSSNEEDNCNKECKSLPSRKMDTLNIDPVPFSFVTGHNRQVESTLLSPERDVGAVQRNSSVTRRSPRVLRELQDVSVNSQSEAHTNI